MIKIRTITSSFHLNSPKQAETSIKYAVNFNRQAKDFFESQGYEVQTTRISTNSWQQYLQELSAGEVVAAVQKLEETCQNLGGDFFSIGYADTPESIALIPAIIKNTSMIFCSSKMGVRKENLSFVNTKASAMAIKSIAEETEGGLGNFRFCAWANCNPGIPFFPVSYHDEDDSGFSFALGLECGDLARLAFSQSQNLEEAEENFSQVLKENVLKVEAIAENISNTFKWKYKGIDSSLVPALDKSSSIAYSYESLGLGKFGNAATLAISAMITRVLKNVPVRLCGYSGLMLPVCEDVGLAERANEGTYNLTNLLLYSAVCGCGLDTVPLPGDISVEKLEAILLDVASLAIKLDKPLSARLFPIPGKKSGEMTVFDSPYLVNCKIFDV
ncbi:DUF711 family protein [Ancylothrix sp. C2]|uniref:DUF711 family protein n=1 Tax=Ancylothrix sp. D3o TaxID=2953691 RepID=UPI0021BA64F6|nr:DUF711 family protein [Ancylothrix sp. D3o]MCT7948708.1 DUF711 family protein [Ancylothrix sp. D3o]